MQCEMPVMAINQQLAVSATCDREPDAIDEAIEDAVVAVLNKVVEIHNFLEPITSLNPGWRIRADLPRGGRHLSQLNHDKKPLKIS